MLDEADAVQTNMKENIIFSNFNFNLPFSSIYTHRHTKMLRASEAKKCKYLFHRDCTNLRDRETTSTPPILESSDKGKERRDRKRQRR